MLNFIKDTAKKGKIIDSNQEIQLIVDKAYKSQLIAIDTEFTREKTYYPILSLIQIALDDQVFAIDCLSQADLKPIYQIISDQKIKKILHSCAQDLQIFHQKSNDFPANIYDVQLMANFCGIGFNIGYSGLVEKFIGVEIDKKLQKSNWQKRPLDKKQIEYALIDVLYLEKIYLELLKILRERKREKWFLEEMENIANKVIKVCDDGLYKNFSGQKKHIHKNIYQKNKLKNLILWREEMARKVDVPRQHFLSDFALEKIAINNFDNIDWQDVDFQVLDEEMKDKIKNIFEITENIDVDLQEKNSIIMNEKQKNQFHQAKEMIARIANEEDMKEQFLITTPALKQIILGNKKIDEMLVGWRYFLFGRKLEKLLS